MRSALGNWLSLHIRRLFDVDREDKAVTIIELNPAGDFEIRISGRRYVQPQSRSTVWHHYPSGHRPNSSVELLLTNLRDGHELRTRYEQKERQ